MAFYRHFRSREDLIDEMAEEGFRRFGERLDGCRKDGPIPVMTTMELFLDFAIEEPEFYELMFTTSRSQIRRFPFTANETRPTTFDTLVESVELEMETGALRRREATNTAFTLWAHAQGLVEMFRAGRFGADVGAFRELYRDSFGLLYEGIGV